MEYLIEVKRQNNGIELDFTIDDATERTRLVTQIIEEFESQGRHLSDLDYDLLTNYICCGVTEQDTTSKGLKSPVQKKEIFLEGSSLTPRKKEESLDALLESPTFNESQVTTIRYKIPKPNFQRSKILSDPRHPNATQIFNPLWMQIDQLDRLIHIYQKKEVNPPPTLSELDKVSKITPYKLYRLKKLVIEYRKEQYTLNDFFNPTLQRHELIQSKWRGGEIDSPVIWGDGFYEFGPLGLFTQNNPIFTKPYTKGECEPRLPDLNAPVVVDFRNPTHVYMLAEFREELEDSAVGSTESPIPLIYRTFDYYVEKAKLSEEQREILNLKILHYPNSFIRQFVNKKYNRTHPESYISTIYTKNICGAISIAAQIHYDTYVARGIPSKFKKCKDCGEIYLIDGRNFTRQSRSRDGYQCRCKWCEKEKRKK